MVTSVARPPRGRRPDSGPCARSRSESCTPKPGHVPAPSAGGLRTSVPARWRHAGSRRGCRGRGGRVGTAGRDLVRERLRDMLLPNARPGSSSWARARSRWRPARPARPGRGGRIRRTSRPRKQRLHGDGRDRRRIVRPRRRAGYAIRQCVATLAGGGRGLRGHRYAAGGGWRRRGWPLDLVLLGGRAPSTSGVRSAAAVGDVGRNGSAELLVAGRTSAAMTPGSNARRRHARTPSSRNAVFALDCRVSVHRRRVGRGDRATDPSRSARRSRASVTPRSWTRAC